MLHMIHMTQEGPMDGFHHLLDLSMTINGCETDREELLEAHATLSAMNDDCGTPASVWPAPRGARMMRARVAA
jgi:hypothetical protein